MALPEEKCCLSKRVVILSLALYHFAWAQVRSVPMSSNDAWILQPCCFIGDWCFRCLLRDLASIYRVCLALCQTLSLQICVAHHRQKSFTHLKTHHNTYLFLSFIL